MIQFKLGEHPSFKGQFDKVTTAYIDNRLNPYNNCACFIGNILHGDAWGLCRFSSSSEVLSMGLRFIESSSKGLYTRGFIMHLEAVFLSTINDICPAEEGVSIYTPMITLFGSKSRTHHPDYEKALFEAMTVTLEELRNYHEMAGEIIDAPPVLAKRGLQKV